MVRALSFPHVQPAIVLRTVFLVCMLFKTLVYLLNDRNGWKVTPKEAHGSSSVGLDGLMMVRLFSIKWSMFVGLSAWFLAVLRSVRYVVPSHCLVFLYC